MKQRHRPTCPVSHSQCDRAGGPQGAPMTTLLEKWGVLLFPLPTSSQSRSMGARGGIDFLFSAALLSSPCPHAQLPSLSDCRGPEGGVGKLASGKGLSKTTCGAAGFRKPTRLRHQRGLDSNPSSTTYCQPDLTSRSLSFPTLPSGQGYRNVTQEALGQGLAPTCSPTCVSPPCLPMPPSSTFRGEFFRKASW